MAVEGVAFHLSIQVVGNEELREEAAQLVQELTDKLCERDGISLVKVAKSKFTISDIRDTPPRKG
jgi:hypothetical protein